MKVIKGTTLSPRILTRREADDDLLKKELVRQYSASEVVKKLNTLMYTSECQDYLYPRYALNFLGVIQADFKSGYWMSDSNIRAVLNLWEKNLPDSKIMKELYARAKRLYVIRITNQFMV